MSGWLNKIRRQRLFLQIFIVMVVSIIAVSVLTSWVTIRMSERLFMETFGITNSKVLGQIKTNFESFNYSIVTAANNAQQSGSIKTYLTGGETDSMTTAKTFYNMGQQMKRVQSNVDAYEVGITVTGVNGRSYSPDRSYWPLTGEELASSPITRATLAEPKRLMYHFDRPDTADSPARESVIVASKALLERTTGDIYGVLYIAIRERDFKPFYTNFTAIGNDVAIVDRAGVIVSSNRTELVGRAAPDLLGYAKEIERDKPTYKNATVMGAEKLVLSEYLPSYDFYLINLIDKRLAMSQMIDVKTVALICFLIVAVSLVTVFLITRRLTKSLTKLVGQMAGITQNNFGNYIDVEGSYETRELGHAFNYMLDELHDYIKQLIETQKGQRQAELKALQMQINPHFLYNTLASIKTLVQQGSREKAADTINALITLLQNTIGDVSETVTVEQELVNLRNYVHINHVRYGERIKVNYFVAPDCASCRLPKLVLQPFLENAFFHGFNKKREGYIYVLVSREGDELICEVVDNGDGMEAAPDDGTLPDRKRARKLLSGIGIRNVDERIRLLYGRDYGVNIASTPGEGTRVRIRLPFLQE